MPSVLSSRRESRATPGPSLTVDDWVELTIANTWTATVGGAPRDYHALLESNPVVFACVLQRMQMFEQAVFRFQRVRNGRPGDLFGTDALGVLEEPWPGASTSDLLRLWELDLSVCGNAYAFAATPDGARLEVPDPRNVNIVSVKVHDSESRRLLYVDVVGYEVGEVDQDPVFVPVENMAHYYAMPDRSRRRGMSWMSPVFREAVADNQMTEHKGKFFELAATPNLLVKTETKLTDDQFEALRRQMDSRYAGVDNAYRTMVLEGGADVSVVGRDMQQMAFRDVQDAGENRITLASGVPAPLVGVQLGTNPTYNNFNTARRHFADSWARPAWARAANALAKLVSVPLDARLYYDDRDIDALQQDADDEAGIRQKDAATIRQLVDGGYDPDSVTAAVVSNDMTLLVHTGKLSVQLQPPEGNDSGGEV